MTVWSAVDEPVLRWLQQQPSSFLPQSWGLKLALRPEPEPFEDLPNLDSRQADEALLRLSSHRLIDGHRSETMGYSLWSKLRITGFGLQVLGEWPELDRLSSAAGLRLLFARLAEEADDSDDRSALRQLVGFLGQVGEGVVEQTLNDVVSARAEALDDT